MNQNKKYIQTMIRPKPYLSFSQMTKLEMSEEKYIEEYLYKNRGRTSRNMAYGSQFAEGLEKDELTGDPLLDLMATRIPKFELRDRPVESKKGVEIMFERDKTKVCVPVLKNMGDDIPLLAVPDTAKKDYSAFKEYKTSTRQWTQKMADESGQITFYATAIYIATGKIPEDIELVSVETAYNDDGSMTVTGEMLILKTRRTLADVLRMQKRMRKAWSRIKEL